MSWPYALLGAIAIGTIVTVIHDQWRFGGWKWGRKR